MDLETLRTFFLWCTILNAGLMAVGFLFCVFAGGWVYRIHSRLFAMPRETFNAVIYILFGWYKMAILVFNLVPYLALLILTG